MRGVNRLKDFCREFKDVAIALAMLALMVSAVAVAIEAVPAIREFTGLLANARSGAATFDSTLKATNRTLAELPQKVLSAIGSEGEKTRTMLATQVTGAVTTLDKRIGKVTATLDGQLAALRTEVLVPQLTALREQIGPVLDTTQRTVAAVQPVLEHADKLVVDIRPQALGLVAGWKVVGGQAATTMRAWQEATPALIKGVNRIVANSDRTTDATAGVMTNFREATKPLPRWMRIGLGVAPPLAQTAAGAATAFALTGK